MKIFVSGKVGEEDSTRDVMELFRSQGHEVTFDWTTIRHLKPYEENREASERAADLEIEGVKSADVLIVLAHRKGVGLFVELGAALALSKPVIVKYEGPAPTMFMFHRLVKVVATNEELEAELANLERR